ncbi:MAG: DUF5320 domain-containing protein [Desulfobacterota bacterium]|nr:DUF5320 domain-containing protein [Thermodesulfobacteriota bacterium]
MTGRGGRYCAGFGMPGFNRSGWASLFGRSWGPGPGWGGRGFCRWFFGSNPGWGPSWAASNPDLEKQSLKGQAEALQGELDRIKKRIQEMEAGEASG